MFLIDMVIELLHGTMSLTWLANNVRVLNYWVIIACLTFSYIQDKGPNLIFMFLFQTSCNIWI